MLRGLQQVLDYSSVLNKQNLQTERAHPAQRGSWFFTSFLMQPYKTKMAREPSVRGMGTRGLLCLTQRLLSALLLLGTLAAVAQVTLLRTGGEQSTALAVRAQPAAPPCIITFPHRVPELERISTLSSLRPTWPKWEILSPHRIANLAIGFF